VLKVLHLGLTVDTRRVEIVHVSGLDASESPHLLDCWAAIEVHCTLPDVPPLCAWWRADGDYVLTLVAVPPPSDLPCPDP
jgi:hypothetical protein